MTLHKDAVYEAEYNCKTTDLIDGYPPDDEGEDGSKVYVWNVVTKELDSIFKKVFGKWMKL